MRNSVFVFPLVVLTLTALALTAATTLAPRPAAAAYNLPWCAQYFDKGAVRSCAFFSYEQCRETVNGVGGWCFRNPFGPPAYGAYEPRRKRRHYDY
jgi:uncharacterized protein DUF3551